jgi:hypothetical protein
MHTILLVRLAWYIAAKITAIGFNLFERKLFHHLE